MKTKDVLSVEEDCSAARSDLISTWLRTCMNTKSGRTVICRLEGWHAPAQAPASQLVEWGLNWMSEGKSLKWKLPRLDRWGGDLKVNQSVAPLALERGQAALPNLQIGRA